MSNRTLMSNQTTDLKPVLPVAPLRLRRVGERFMLVQEQADRVDLTYVYTLNASAAWLWEAVCAEPLAQGELTRRFAARFGIGEERARTDVAAQLAEWREMGLINI